MTRALVTMTAHFLESLTRPETIKAFARLLRGSNLTKGDVNSDLASMGIAVLKATQFARRLFRINRFC